MTDIQRLRAAELAQRFNCSLNDCSILENPFDLPSGWVSIVVIRPDGRHAITAGISPEGDIHS